MKDIKIREEISQDTDAIREIIEKAFSQFQEANIVDRLRANCQELLSLVAIQDEKIIGHILFNPVTIEGTFGVLKGMGLAPMALLPEFQRQGVGTGFPLAIIDQPQEFYPFVSDLIQSLKSTPVKKPKVRSFRLTAEVIS